MSRLDAELALAVREQPLGDRDAVVGTGRVRVLGREPVVDRHDRHAEPVAQVDAREVAHLRRADHHPAAVEVEVDRGRGTVGREHAARHAGDLAHHRVGRREVDALHRLAGPARPARRASASPGARRRRAAHQSRGSRGSDASTAALASPRIASTSSVQSCISSSVVPSARGDRAACGRAGPGSRGIRHGATTDNRRPCRGGP